MIVEIQELRIGGSDGYVRVVLHTAGARAGPLEASEWGLNLERHHGSWALQEAKLLAET